MARPRRPRFLRLRERRGGGGGTHLWVEEHRERKEKLEAAADEARAILKQRRVTLDRMETITAFAKDMSGYLRTSELTESRAFIRSFVKESR